LLCKYFKRKCSKYVWRTLFCVTKDHYIIASLSIIAISLFLMITITALKLLFLTITGESKTLIILFAALSVTVTRPFQILQLWQTQYEIHNNKSRQDNRLQGSISNAMSILIPTFLLTQKVTHEQPFCSKRPICPISPKVFAMYFFKTCNQHFQYVHCKYIQFKSLKYNCSAITAKKSICIFAIKYYGNVHIWLWHYIMFQVGKIRNQYE